MQSIQQNPEDAPPVDLLPRQEPSHAAVRMTLNGILQSRPFRTSIQCQNLLIYIVQHSLQDDDTSLRERILGIEVFGRSPDYNTSDDPVVRMRAADVRKRLAQFYQSDESSPELIHIELKPGSYRATFHLRHEPKEEQPAETKADPATPEIRAEVLSSSSADPLVNENPLPRKSHRPVLAALLAGLLCALLLGAAGWKAWTARSLTAQKRFWAPLTRSNQPVLLYVGSNVAYRFTPDYMARYQKEHGLKENGPEFFVDLPKGGIIQADDLVPVRDTFVSVADLAAATQVVTLMRGWSKPLDLRTAADLSMGDIRNTPAILIGGFNDTWALETTNDLPYSFRDGTRIENKADPAHSWTVASGTGEMTKDFALISRLLHANTGGPVLSIGGIGSFGTQAAAEFVTSPEKMSELLKSAPPGWENKNMQAVLRIKVVRYEPVAVDVVATTYW